MKFKPGSKIRGFVTMECIGPDGGRKWIQHGENIVVDTGINYIFANDIEAATLYVGLKDTGTPVAADTMASHASWAEIHTIYSEGTRPAFTEDASTTDEKVSNSGSPAAFSITGTDTVFGAFLTTDSTKNGTAGTLIGVEDFGASQAVSNGDTLNVTYEITGADA